MARYQIPYWKKAPFVRVIIPFICGVITGRFSPFAEIDFLYQIALSLSCLIVFTLLQRKWQFTFRSVNGVLLMLIVAHLGGYIASYSNPFNVIKLVESCGPGSTFIATIAEPPVEKKSTWKALAKIESISTIDNTVLPDTYLLVYFKKDRSRPPPAYGTMIASAATLQRIQNSPDNTGFNYQEYCDLNNIHFQAFIRPSDYCKLDSTTPSRLYSLVFDIQDWVLVQLRKYVPGKKEAGLAKALLIGYKNDLDRDLIQSYSNTGVVHVVAISGLHLGLIYAILAAFCNCLKNTQGVRVLKPIIILSGLWIFSLTAGASPSVLRSAVMFSFIVVGDSFGRKSGMLNSLSASAFFLLCINPYWLWDLGFILSYAALLSIMVFQNAVYEMFDPPYKLLQQIWKLVAVTIAAQVLTMPIIIYYFGQFPNLFIFTNLVAIPLSSIILLGEIVVCVLFFLEPVATVIGQGLSILIRCMNTVVELADGFPFSSTKGLNINFFQLLLLYAFITFVAEWLLNKNKIGLPAALISLIVFFLVVLHPFQATR